jgi:uncharacterized protein (TIGR02265 family)
VIPRRADLGDVLQAGVRNIEGFFETFLGTPMLALLRLLGPKRTLGRMQKNVSSANNYTETVLVELGDGRFQMWVNEPKDMRHFMHGVMQRGVQLAGAEAVRFIVLDVDGDGTVFEITL